MDDEGHWHASSHAPDPLLLRPVGRGEPARYGLDLPEAENASIDRELPFPRLTLYLLRTGDVGFKGIEWPWTTGAGPPQRRAALVALRNELQRLTADLEMREPIRPDPSVVMLHGDRRAPWSVFREIAAVLLEPTIGVRLLQWAVYKPRRTAPSRGVEHRQSAVMSPLASAPTPVPPLAPRLTVTLTRTGGGTRLTIAERTWSFGDPGDGFDDPEFLRRANASWAEIEAWLPEAAADTSYASIEVVGDGRDLWWAYVVKTLDLLLGAGIRDVSVPDAGLHLLLDEVDEDVPPVVVEDSGVTPSVVVLCALAVLAAFAITFLPRRRRRTSRRGT